MTIEFVNTALEMLIGAAMEVALSTQDPAVRFDIIIVPTSAKLKFKSFDS
jgi:hypothetical protein